VTAGSGPTHPPKPKPTSPPPPPRPAVEGYDPPADLDDDPRLWTSESMTGPTYPQVVIKRELWARLDEVMRPAGSMHETDVGPTTLGDWLGDRVYAALLEAGLRWEVTS
jgi:hypothetical protein